LLQKSLVPMNFKRAVIEVNGGCNYTCQMCPQTNPGRSKNFLKKLSLEDFHYALEQVGHTEAIQLEGSGEPTLNSNLMDYIKLAKNYTDSVNIFTNGFRFKGDYMKRCVDAGLDLVRFSVIGYSPSTYKDMMNVDAFDTILQNALELKNYTNRCTLSSYHLILDNDNINFEIDQYRKNFIDIVDAKATIWKQHNWSGMYDNPYQRKGSKKSCGRPFADEITIRAGGLDGEWGAVHPCCQVLGRDDEAVLGHLSTNTVKEIYEGEAYNKLREAHTNETFDDISYCKDCDFLYDDNDVLVYSNIENFKLRQMMTTSLYL
jgi:MoaA/NifB/PqqE/SkfB family radical SAM enzyme